MSATFQQVLDLIERGEIRISAHGYDELSEDGITVRDVLLSVAKAVVVEDYPHYEKGPSVLVLQWDQISDPIHVVWGIPKGLTQPAVLITAYRPDPIRWSSDFTERKR